MKIIKTALYLTLAYFCFRGALKTINLYFQGEGAWVLGLGIIFVFAGIWRGCTRKVVKKDAKKNKKASKKAKAKKK